MTGRITKGNEGKRRQSFEAPKVLGGQKLPEETETKIMDQRVRQRATVIENKKGEKDVIQVKSHTRKRKGKGKK